MDKRQPFTFQRRSLFAFHESCAKRPALLLCYSKVLEILFALLAICPVRGRLRDRVQGAIKDWNPLLLNALLLGPFFGVNLWAYRAKKFVPHSLFILLTTFVPFAIGVIFVICLYVGDLWLKSMNTGGR